MEFARRTARFITQCRQKKHDTASPARRLMAILRIRRNLQSTNFIIIMLRFTLQTVLSFTAAQSVCVDRAINNQMIEFAHHFFVFLLLLYFDGPIGTQGKTSLIVITLLFFVSDFFINSLGKEVTTARDTQPEDYVRAREFNKEVADLRVEILIMHVIIVYQSVANSNQTVSTLQLVANIQRFTIPVPTWTKTIQINQTKRLGGSRLST